MLDHPNIRHVLTAGNKKKLMDIESSCCVTLQPNLRLGHLTVYGSTENINKAQTAINR